MGDGVVCTTHALETFFTGLPLHYYLARRASDLDLATVKMLVEGDPRSLINEGYCHPIHVILGNPKICELQYVLEFLLEYQPSSIHFLDEYDRTPLNMACSNPNVTLDLVRLLLNAWPEATRQLDNCGEDERGGYLPIHNLCRNEGMDDVTAKDILHLLLNSDPPSVRERDTDGEFLPIHHAAGGGKSTDFCKILVKAFPESLRMQSMEGKLPIHAACSTGKVDLVQYLLELIPESIHTRDNSGCLPIHEASVQGNAEVIKFLVKCDPDAASKETTNELRWLPFHHACYGLSNCYSKNLIAVKILYDEFPEAIFARDRDGQTPLEIVRSSERYQHRHSLVVSFKESLVSLVNFLEDQLEYVRAAQDATHMTTPDSDGYLPLHRALLRGDVSLGSIKLLVRGNPAAVQVANQKGVLPLHTACYNATAGIVQFLVEAYDGLNVCDENKDYPLHFACRAANLDVIKYLIERNVPSVSERNNDNKLPFHVLLENKNEQVNRESPEFIETCWHLLRAHPETVMAQTNTRKRKR